MSLAKRYVCASFLGRDLCWFRLGGQGLANCLIIASKAVVRAHQTGCRLLRPTWERMGLGQWLRHEKDKRFYCGLFSNTFLMQAEKMLVYLFARRHVEWVSGTDGFFEDLQSQQEIIHQYFDANILPHAIETVPPKIRAIAVHVRLGDYPDVWRTPIAWYVKRMEELRRRVNDEVEFHVYSDGEDSELREVLSVPRTKRVFYGNALADMIAISRSIALIASNSTFSGWAAFYGQIPCVFRETFYSGRILESSLCECRVGDEKEIPASLVDAICSICRSRKEQTDGE